MKVQTFTYFWLFAIPVVLLGFYAIKRGIGYRLQNQSEAAVSDALITSLPLDKWHVLNNITLKTDKGTTQVDHILVSRFGVFVIETKDYKGWIFGDAKSKKWTQVLYHLKFSFQNPVHQNYGHLKAVEALLDFMPPKNIEGIVVFTGSAKFKTTPPPNVYTLWQMIDYLKNKTEEVITENRMQFCVGRIECARLQLTWQTDVQHRQNLANRRQKKDPN